MHSINVINQSNDTEYIVIIPLYFVLLVIYLKSIYYNKNILQTLLVMTFKWSRLSEVKWSEDNTHYQRVAHCSQNNHVLTMFRAILLAFLAHSDSSFNCCDLCSLQHIIIVVVVVAAAIIIIIIICLFRQTTTVIDNNINSTWYGSKSESIPIHVTRIILKTFYVTLRQLNFFLLSLCSASL